jgi:hypothetical protein
MGNVSQPTKLLTHRLRDIRLHREKEETNLARRYALPYHPTSGREWKSVVMRGMAWLGESGNVRGFSEIIEGILKVVASERI